MRNWIRLRTMILTAVAALATFAPTAGHADPYKWCAIYSGTSGSGTNCGFITLAQCRATIRGVGGACEPHQFYTGPDEKPTRRHHRRARR